MNKTSRQNGFTLVEMIVSIAIFMIVAVIAVGALLKVIDANKKAQSLKTAINNANAVLELMSRDISTGNQFRCILGTGTNMQYPNLNQRESQKTSCTISEAASGNSGWTLSFTTKKRDSSDTCYVMAAYRFDPHSSTGQIQRSEQIGCNAYPMTFGPIIPPDILVDSFAIKTVSGGANEQSYVRLHMQGETGIKSKNKTFFNIQTTISQRVHD